MDIFQLILWPIRWAVEAVLAIWHYIFTALGLPADDGITWVLSIIGVVVVVRSLLIPVTIKQIRSQRKMMELAPEMRKIQAKYKGKRDQFSQQQMQQETFALYKKHGTNPLASCLPMIVQMPIFFGLFYVLRDAANNETGLGMMSADLTSSFNNAVFFGAPLKLAFGEAWSSGEWAVIIFLGIIMVLMIVSQFFTQLQIMSKNVSDETKASPMYQQQRILLYLIPFAFLFSGFMFPLALNIYWFSSNLWTMAQQAIVINQMPTPGSEAWRNRQARLKAKGKLTDDEVAELNRVEGIKVSEGQRQQPMSAKRAKKKGN